MYFLENVSPPKPLNVATSNFVAAVNHIYLFVFSSNPTAGSYQQNMDLQERETRLVIPVREGQEVGAGQGQVRRSSEENVKVIGETGKIPEDLIRRSLRKLRGIWVISLSTVDKLCEQFEPRSGPITFANSLDADQAR